MDNNSGGATLEENNLICHASLHSTCKDRKFIRIKNSVWKK